MNPPLSSCVGDNIVDGDTTPSGYMRNFVTKKKGTIRRAITIEGALDKSVLLEAKSVGSFVSVEDPSRLDASTDPILLP